MNVRAYRGMDQYAVIELWRVCHLIVPWNNPEKDIERKLKVNPELFLVGEHRGEIIASAMAGYEGHRGWINYLAVHPDFQGKGFGRQMMTHAEALLHAMGCPKINLQVRSGNSGVIAFYNHLNYRMDDVVSLGKHLDEEPEPGNNADQI